MFGMIISCSHTISFLVSQLSFNNVTREKAAFV